MRRRWPLAVAAAAAVAVAGCGSQDGGDGDVTLRFVYWGNDDRAQATNEAIALFEERHPNIRVESSFSSFENHFQKLSTEVAGGNAPDIVQMDYRYLREYADRGVLLDLASGEAGENLATEDIPDELLASGQLDGQLFGIPMAQNTQVLIYDSELWEDAGVTPEDGWTWDDFHAAALAISEGSDAEPSVFGTSDFGGAEDWFEVWLRQQGKELFTDDGQIGYDGEDLAEFWELAAEFRESGAATPPEISTGMDGSIATSPMGKNRSASEFGYDSGFTSYEQTLGRPMGLAPFPSSGDELGQYAKPSMLASVAANTDHPAEAALFVDFMINDVDAGLIQGTTRGMPVNAEVREAVGGELEGAELAVFTFEEEIADQLATAPPPPPPGEGAVKRDFQRVNDDVAFGRLTVEEGVERFLTDAKRQLGG
ncbi:carbohydrate ABC transporter substrate-binding protein [Actinoalloteichus sp. AHMU CJ021]|uniref:Multiple sugar transport system substrate-binding protein n=1 Tax=Actinoalloteichus caeruleus DSM 43889 TaxID=1120930 RepID=A0ABT1JBJ5_ACTCY|nr:ABC transporter substrate-binding protein [Actinoalloteichus caeruleus]AUS80517.1 carbohydrate ABC transporter substrate-binding protein [Actinoalloteichus sp. AHMU CJ021]MCP2329875.1 multiple sugar transport system substrate-binding protein [Actinoalloteichus caeruleus DSM 43889]